MRVLAVLVLLLASTLPAVASAAPAEDQARARFVVGFHGPLPSARAGDTFHGASVERADAALGFVVVESGRPEEFRGRARRDASVRYVEADPERPLLAVAPNDPGFGQQYGPQHLRAPEAWDTHLGSTAASVCVVDTGVRATHQDFAGRWRGGIDLHNYDADPSDDHGHGTHVAGTAAAGVNDSRGIAGVGNVALYGVKGLSATGSGYLSTVASGIRWCADNAGPRTVISLSLGSPQGHSTLQDALRYAVAKDALVVAAAGNDGPCADCVNYPAAYPEALAVTCTDAAKAECSFSSDGAQAELAAPGAGILSAYHTGDAAYAYLSGTSMSTPHVSGVAALVWSAAPHLNASALRAVLAGTAADLGPGGWDEHFGHGLVDAKAALDRALLGNGTTAPQPPPTAPDLLVSRLALSIVGGKAVVTSTVTNRGNASAEGLTVRFVVNDAQVLGESAFDGLLLPGASTTLASPAWTVPAGNHTLTALADPENLLAEPDEANNEGKVAFNHAFSTFASARAPAKPDLALRYVFAAYADARVTYGAVVVNEGKASTGNATTLRFRLDGGLVQDLKVPALHGGVSTQVYGPPRIIAPGTHVLRAAADAFNQVAEADEKDNAREVAFVV